MTVPTDTDAHGGWQALEPPGLLRTMARAWPVLLVGTVLAGLFGWALSSNQSPLYEADATLFLAAPGEASLFRQAVSRDFEQHLLDEVEHVRSEPVVTRAAERLGPGWSVDEIGANLVVRADLARNAIQLVGRAPAATGAVELTTAASVAYQAAALERTQAAAETAIDRLSSHIDELLATAADAQRQLEELQAGVEAQLAGLPPAERIRVASARLAIDPGAQAAQRQRDDALSELAALRSETRRVRIDASLQGSGVSREEPATTAQQVRPKPLRDGALAAAFGFVLIAGVSWARAEYRPRRFGPRDAARLLGIPIVGQVPDTNGAGLVVPEATHPHRQMYEATAAAVQFAAGVGDGTAIIVVTSVVSSDGSSSVTALSLALEGARDGKRVVLVDGDPRNSRLTHALRMGGIRGWSDGGGDGHEMQQPGLPPYLMSTPDGTRLSFMPTGTRTRPIENGGLSSAIEDLRTHADLIVTHVGPVVHVTDGSLFSPFVDAVVVLLPRVSAAQDLEHVRYRLGIASAPAVGVVIGRARGPRHSGRLRRPGNLPSLVEALPARNGDSPPRVSPVGTPPTEEEA